MAVPGQERVLWLQACASTHWLRLSALVTRTSGRLTTPIVHSFIPSQTIEDYECHPLFKVLQSPLQDPWQLAFFSQEVSGP